MGVEEVVLIPLDHPCHLAGGDPAAGIVGNLQGVLELLRLHRLDQGDPLQGSKPGQNGAHLLPGQGVVRGELRIGGAPHQAVSIGPVDGVVVGVVLRHIGEAGRVGLGFALLLLPLLLPVGKDAVVHII